MRSKESHVQKKKRAVKVLTLLNKLYPDATTALEHTSAFDLLISTILSAQCTDERVNRVTNDLFKKYRTPKDYADTNPDLFEQEIKSTGFYRAKAKNIINCCKALIEKYHGKVPDTMEGLVQLPGVGRKTANVILGNYFGIAVGIVVDTHVKRLAYRLGFTKHTDPEKIEQDLIQIIPKKDWIIIGNILIWHGRKVCSARKPKCNECALIDLCPSTVE